MYKMTILACATAALFAQTPPAAPPGMPQTQALQQAPPDVDAALRARISQFYQFEVAGKYYQALQLVADESKDLFVSTGKVTYFSFQIRSIEYTDFFTRANVYVMMEHSVPAEGFVGQRAKGMVHSRWKLENGQWCWYMDPKKELLTPFGKMKVADRPVPASGGSTPPPASPVKKELPPPQKIPESLTSLRADKSSVELKGAGASDKITIVNPSPWAASLDIVETKLPGFTARLDRTLLKPGDKAVLSIETYPGAVTPKEPVTITLLVAETKQMIPIKVSFGK